MGDKYRYVLFLYCSVLILPSWQNHCQTRLFTHWLLSRSRSEILRNWNRSFSPTYYGRSCRRFYATFLYLLDYRYSQKYGTNGFAWSIYCHFTARYHAYHGCTTRTAANNWLQLGSSKFSTSKTSALLGVGDNDITDSLGLGHSSHSAIPATYRPMFHFRRQPFPYQPCGPRSRPLELHDLVHIG